MGRVKPLPQEDIERIDRYVDLAKLYGPQKAQEIMKTKEKFKKMKEKR